METKYVADDDIFKNRYSSLGHHAMVIALSMIVSLILRITLIILFEIIQPYDYPNNDFVGKGNIVAGVLGCIYHLPISTTAIRLFFTVCDGQMIDNFKPE